MLKIVEIISVVWPFTHMHIHVQNTGLVQNNRSG